MALEAGSVFVKLGGLFARDEFDKWDRAVDQERVKARDPIEAKLGADSSRLTSDLADARGKLTAFSSTGAEAKVGVDENFLARSLGTARSMMAAFDATAGGSVKVDVELDTTAAEAKIAALKTELALLGGDVRIGSQPLGFGTGSVIPSVIRSSAGNVLASGAAQGSTLGVRGIRGPGGGTSDNPIVVTLEAGRFTPLGARAAQIGYPSGTDQGDVSSHLSANIPVAGRQPAGLLGPGYTGSTQRYGSPPFVPDPFGPRRVPAGQPGAGSIAGFSPYDYRFAKPMPSGMATAGDPNDPFAIFPPGGYGGGGDGGGGIPPVAISPGGGDGGGGGGGGIGRFLFGAGAGIGSRRFGPFNPFQYGIHGPLGAVGAAVGLGPEHLASAALALGGSAAGGAAGAGLTALGGLGTIAVGGGSDLAVLKSTVTQTQEISKAMDAVQQATARYGATSTQAKDATAALNTQMALLGNTAGVQAEAGLAKATSALSDQWNKATSAARVQAVNILTQVVNLGKDYVPRVAEAARQNLTIINQGIKPLFDWLEGPQGIKIWNDLEDEFRKNLPTAVHAFVQVVEALLKTIDDASKYAGGFVGWLDKIATRWNTMDPKVLSDKIARLHGDFYLWQQLIKAVLIDLDQLFKAGSGEGNDLVARFTTLLQKWGEWEKSVQGQDFLHNFFKQRENELMALLTLVGQLVHVYGQFFIALQPLVPAVTAFIRAFSGAFGTFNTVVLVPIAHALGFLLNSMADLGKYSDVFKLGFLVPMGAFLATWKLFGLEAAKNLLNFSGHIEAVRTALVGARAAMAALFAGEGVGAAWQRLKDAFKSTTPESPAASMEAAMISGGKAAGEEIAAAMVAAGREAGATIGGAEVAGGAKVAAEVGGAEVLGGAGAAGAGGARFLAGPGGDIVDTAAAGAVGSGSASLLSSLRSGVGTVAGGVGRALPFALTGLAAGQLYSHFTQSGNLLGRVGAGAGVGASAGAAGGAFAGGVGALPGAIIGGIAGGGAALASGLLGIGGPSKAEQELASFEKQVKAIPNTAALSVDAIRKLQNQATELANKVPAATKGLNTFWHQLEQLPQVAGAEQWNKQFNQAWQAVNSFTVRGGDSIKNLRDRFDTNMRLIASTVGIESGAGQKLAEENFNKLVSHVVSAMSKGKISVEDGMKFMRQVADKGGQNMKDDMQGHMDDILKVIEDSWKKGHTSTQTALDQLRLIYKNSNDHIRKDIQDHYTKLLDDAKAQHDAGLLTDQQYSDKRAKINHDMAVAIRDGEIKLSKSQAAILDGTNQATAAGVDELFSTLNKALKQLNVKEVNWSVSKVGNVVTTAVNNTVSGIAGLLSGTVGGAAGGGGAPSHGGTFAVGGILPGSEYGYGDEMTLVDPQGRPRAKMAGDEAIFNRWQMPYVEAGLQMLGFDNGANDLWNTVTRPHGYAGGGKLPFYAQGGQQAGYVFPFGPGLTWGRTDMGLDMGGSGFIGAIGNAVVKRVTPQGDSTGWPGASGAGTGAMIVYQLTDGQDAGRFIYLAENVDPTVSVDQRLTPGQAIAHARGFYPFLEMGWAIDASGTTAAAYHASSYPGHSNTPEGIDFTNFIHGLAHGKIVGGMNILGGAAAPAWNDIKQPHVQGIGGPFGNMGDSVLGKVTKAANDYGRQHAPSGAPSGVGGVSGTGGAAGISLPGGWFRIGATIDPTGGQTGDPNFTFAELLEAGANAGMRPDITQLLGLQRGSYGMPMGTSILIRSPGAHNQFRIVKNDVGSGQRGNAWFKIDLHPGIARALNWSPNGPVDVKRAAQGGKLNVMSRIADHIYGDKYFGMEGVDPASLANMGLSANYHAGGGYMTGSAAKPRHPEPRPRHRKPIIRKARTYAAQKAQLTQDQKNQLFASRYNEVWGRLASMGALPPGATKPAMSIVSNDSGQVFWGEAAGATGQVWYSDNFVSQFLDPNNEYHPYALDEQLHEMVHALQTPDVMGGPVWMREGGAQAWSDEWAMKLYPGIYPFTSGGLDSSYTSYVEQVKSQLGMGWVNGGQFGFARGGQLPGYSVGGDLRAYAAHSRSNRNHSRNPRQPKRKPRPKQRSTKRVPPLSHFINTVPGTEQFSADDAAIAKLDDLYSRQESLFNLYDTTPTGGLPVGDMNTLTGLRIQEWNILDKEYTQLPAVVAKITSTLNGKLVFDTGSGGRRHGHPIASTGAPPGQHHPVAHQVGGINQEVDTLQGLLDSDEKLVQTIQIQELQEQQAAAATRHAIGKNALRAAEQLAGQLAPMYDRIISSVTQAMSITDQIANLPLPVDLAGLRGNAYGRAQQGNKAVARQRTQLSSRRTKLLEGNQIVRAQIGKVLQEKQRAALRYRAENFDAAWVHTQNKFKLQIKLRKLRDDIATLKAKLAKEKALQKQYQDASQAINTRLYGGGPSDPGGTSVLQQLGDIGFDILQLRSEGATNVSGALVSEITDVLHKLGLEVPVAVQGPSDTAASTAAQAFQDFMNFQSSRADLFASFGSNFVGAGQNPFGSPAALGAGVQYYGAAAGAGAGPGVPPGFAQGGWIPGGSGPVSPGETTINIEQNFSSGPPDPHTWSAGVSHELGAMV